MAKRSSTLPIASIELEPTLPLPIYRQLYDQLRQAILTGRLKGGTRLPSTRLFADELGVARNTVLNAFEQLLAEGYLYSRIGAGTYVATVLPEELLNAEPPSDQAGHALRTGRRLSQRGRQLAAAAVEPYLPAERFPAFKLGMPALDSFPFKLWGQLWAARWGSTPRELLTYGEAAGYRELREAIAGYLRSARAVRCEADQVIIVAGTQQGMDLAARLLLDEGDEAWIEDPGYLGAWGALASAGARPCPVPVDSEGLNVEAGMASCPGARLAYVSPSHQHPLGVTMSLRRRLALLDWASRNGAWIIEDDYDSEYRYSGRPLATLQGLDRDGRVIYIGTFSKVLFPGLRLAYLVVPPDMVDPFVAARTYADRASPLQEQAVLADFIQDGHFARHIRRMRELYGERQGLLVETVKVQMAGLLDVTPSPAGMHLVGWLPEGSDDLEASRRALAFGV
ncbi:MAG: PLP-dependent aminotransferase family protein, partial [Chloroflexota bacterium]|nr:PLP-dependent aminotransferase family protein [Chloroflexota bacterium]